MASDEAKERIRRLQDLLVEFKFKFMQHFGQRIYGPPCDYKGDRPPKGCEVFVTNIPRDVYEDELIRRFAVAGYLYEVKFMMEFSGMNRGFAYFLFLDEASARRAIRMFHGSAISPGDKQLACYQSLDNSRLYVEGFPRDRSTTEIVRALKNLFPHSTAITVFEDPKNMPTNLGIGFIEFETHRQAAEIRKMLWPSRLGLWGYKIFVEWAVPVPNFSECHVVIVTNVGANVNSVAFTNFVMKVTRKRACICNITKRGDVGTIQYLSKLHALNAMEQLEGRELCGRRLNVFLFDCTNKNKDQLMLYLQWADFDQRRVVQSSLSKMVLHPHSSITDLATNLRGYLRDTTDWIFKNHINLTRDESHDNNVTDRWEAHNSGDEHLLQRRVGVLDLFQLLE